ncbi:hypothetical protein N7456_000260 [Penicillium angulare]|uniref:NACHT domain-containing protein n=1 Tax=Penicillium angulare TaxID=116970 RepID=A0A9W9GC70_9EURO|nr:hypothetical protein N7456_000260 [Penicillium angulare]
MSDPNNYTVGWICAITTEYVAARAFLDEEHEGPTQLAPHNTNDYTLGRIGKHNVVISVLPMGSYGIASAAQVAENMLHSFPNVRIGLLVGIGGGAPSPKHDIRLGDVVVSIPSDGQCGVFQYDFGKAIQNQAFQVTAVLDQPPIILRAAVNGLKAQYELDGHELDTSVKEVIDRKPRLRKRYQRPDEITDRLYLSEVVHLQKGGSCEKDCGNDSSLMVPRDPRDEEEDNPVIHYGLIASADQLIGDALIRDKLSSERNVLCFETEAAGLMNGFPCLVIRGICDYSDSHRDENWRGYAAMVAAAYAKDLLGRIAPQQVALETRICEILKPILKQAVETVERIELGLELDRLPTVDGAEFDSYKNQHEEFCLEGTRIEILDEISQWIVSPIGKYIFWLNGMAGTGKSTISRTLARSFKRSKLLGASFFFKRGETNRGNMQLLLPTIAKQLARNFPDLRPGLLNAIKQDPDIAARALAEQFERLLLQPFLGLTDRSAMSPVVIVIDALDECEVLHDVRTLLRLLPRLKQLEYPPVRVFLTSRPEILIRLGFSEIHNDFQDLILHQIPDEVAERDIKLFLQYQLACIKKERTLPSGWPDEKDLISLVKLSIPLFIFAATICRLFRDDQWDPKAIMSEILTYGSEGSQLQSTYMPVLNRILDTKLRKEKVIEEFKTVVGAIILLEIPLSVISLSKLIDVPESVVDTRLNSLHSVINVPKERQLPLRLFHLSFRDFLLHAESKETTPLWVDENESQHKLALRCLKVCCNLKRNMCSLPNDGTLRKDVDQHTIDSVFPPELQYSCRFWAHHIRQCGDIKLLASECLQFLQVHFLHWLEAMNILEFGSEAVSAIRSLKFTMRQWPDIHDFCREAERFTIRNRYIAEVAPLQVYSSAIVFAPKNSTFREFYGGEVSKWIERLPETDETWGTDLWRLESHPGYDNQVAFSDNGELVASRGKDSDICIWHAATGIIQQTFNLSSLFETDAMTSIVFVPGGEQLISCFLSGAVLVWDIAQGTLKRSHNKIGDSSLYVTAQAVVSSDCQKIAISSFWMPIQVCNIATGEKYQQSPFDRVGPVAISSDGLLVASCPFRPSVRTPPPLWIWNTSNDSICEIGHSQKFNSNSKSPLAFSPNGMMLAAGSPSSIQLWDIPQKELKWSFECQSDFVVFSFDNTLLVSGSIQNDIHILSVNNGTVQHVFHDLGYLSCLAFSPTEHLLAASSTDGAIQIRDLDMIPIKVDSRHLDQLECDDTERGIITSSNPLINQYIDSNRVPDTTPQPRPENVRLAALSPDCQLLATILDWGDARAPKIQLWDIETSSLLRKFNPGPISDDIVSVVFSNDNKSLAVHTYTRPVGGYTRSFGDHEICLVDTDTGRCDRKLEDIQMIIELISFSPDNSLLLIASLSGTYRIWNINEGSMTEVIQFSLEKVTEFHLAAFSRTGHFALAFSYFCDQMEHAVYLNKIGTENQCNFLRGHQAALRLMDFTPDGRFLVGVTIHGVTCIWHVSIGSLQNRFEEKRLIHRIEFHTSPLSFTMHLGPPKTQDSPVIPTAHAHSVNGDIFIEQNSEWVSLQGERTLWLPSEYRPACDALVVNNTLVMAHLTGRVSVIEFKFKNPNASSINSIVRGIYPNSHIRIDIHRPEWRSQLDQLDQLRKVERSLLLGVSKQDSD